MAQPIPSLRQSVEWVTDLTDRYRFDPNLRTTVQIVILQIGLTLLSIFVFGWAIQYAQQDTIGSITLHIQEVINGSSTSPNALPTAVEAVRNRTYLFVFGIVTALNILFGYLMAHFALRPTRETLSFQKRFIGNVAHELRTPLAIIKTSIEVVLFDPELPRSVRKTMDSTIDELDRISETINNLLSFDTLSRPTTMQRRQVDLAEVARAVLERHTELAHSRGIELVSELAKNCLVDGNATALEQVVTNLTKNAINYTPANKQGRVTVSVGRTQAGNIVLGVTDNGIGIEQKDLYHIFEPFYRADKSRARGIGTGTSGLGLAIVNEITRLHHGSITLRSAVGHGTTIRVIFPPARGTDSRRPFMAASGSPHEATLDFTT